MIGSNPAISTLAKQLAKLLQTSRQTAITAHVRPDGDAIGSAVGLFHILREQGFNVQIAGLEPIPERYRFLTEGILITPGKLLHPDPYDLLIILDTGSVDRAHEFTSQWQGSVTTINIDHHPTNTCFAEHNLVLPEASATAEIITQLASEAGWSISRPAAAALWVGITTDTGRFAYSCTTATTLQSAATLIATGIDTQDIDQRVFQRLSPGALRLQACAIHKMELLQNDRLAVIPLPKTDFKACGAASEDAEDLINLPRRLDSVDVAVLLTEMGNHAPEAPRTKISMRTRPPFDAGAFCQSLGGGGHARAAGCELPQSLHEAKDIIIPLIQERWFPS